jgi:hypothetical protein
MNFGFTGCHSSLPSLQRMAVYAADALQELEAALLPPVAKPGRGKPAKPDMTAGTKPKPRATRTRATQAAAVEPVAAPATAPAPAPAPATKAPRKRAAARTREAG